MVVKRIGFKLKVLILIDLWLKIIKYSYKEYLRFIGIERRVVVNGFLLKKLY